MSGYIFIPIYVNFPINKIDYKKMFIFRLNSVGIKREVFIVIFTLKIYSDCFYSLVVNQLCEHFI